MDTEFWDVVGRRVEPNECTEGTLVLIEQRGTQRYAVIDETWVDGHGNTQARLRDATPEELASLETGVQQALVIVVP